MTDLGFAFTWYGHACVEIESRAGTRVIVDPWFGNPLSTKAAADLDQCDVLLVTPGHGDHLGGSAGNGGDIDALTIAARTSPRVGIGRAGKDTR